MHINITSHLFLGHMKAILTRQGYCCINSVPPASITSLENIFSFRFSPSRHDIMHNWTQTIIVDNKDSQLTLRRYWPQLNQSCMTLSNIINKLLRDLFIA